VNEEEEPRLSRLTRDLRAEIEDREREISPLRTALSALDPSYDADAAMQSAREQITRLVDERDDLRETRFKLAERIDKLLEELAEAKREASNASARADRLAQLLDEQTAPEPPAPEPEPEPEPEREGKPPPRKRDEPVTVEEVRDAIRSRFSDGRWFQLGALIDVFPDESNTTLRDRINELVERGAVERNGSTGRGAAMRFVKPAGGGPSTRPEGASTTS
jgi:chromosome segregation ATPase